MLNLSGLLKSINLGIYDPHITSTGANRVILNKAFEAVGHCMFKHVVADEDIVALRQELAALNFKAGARPFELSALTLRLLSPSGCFGQALAALGCPSARPVRILAFDKTPISNWNLGWHQDRVVAVRQKHVLPDYEKWTRKNGVDHVEAPPALLEHMFSLRLHLDDVPARNGALKVINGSAALGKLLDADVQRLAVEGRAFVCEAKCGEIMAMKALTVHASEPSQSPSHRRVLHVDYSTLDLPAPLEWALSDSLIMRAT
jgi:hypothetical protein